MLFQVIEARSGAVVFQTEHESCVPDAETLALLRKVGYKTKKSQSGKIQGRYRDWNADLIQAIPEDNEESR